MRTYNALFSAKILRKAGNRLHTSSGRNFRPPFGNRRGIILLCDLSQKPAIIFQIFRYARRFSFNEMPYKVVYFCKQFGQYAGVVKLVYTLVLGTSAFGRGGSSPSTGTPYREKRYYWNVLNLVFYVRLPSIKGLISSDLLKLKNN